MLDLLNTKYAKRDITRKRQEIYDQIISQSPNINSGTIASITAADLRMLFDLYDQVFFENWFQESFSGKLKFSLSRRMTKSAGLTLCPKNIAKIKAAELVMEIRIGVDFLFHYKLLEGSKTVGGIATKNSLEALQLVFEHELCHVLEFILFHESSCSRKRFKTMANNLFGHTESFHRLPTSKQIAGEKLGLKTGDTVSFCFEGEKLTGIIYRINKRATVMVRNKKGPLVDKNGNRFCKYYVPLTLLTKKPDRSNRK